MENHASYEEILTFACRELFEKGNLDAVTELFSGTYIAHAARKQYSGHSFIKRWLKQIRSAFPALKVQRMKIFTLEENTVVWQRTLRGKHRYSLMGIPASQQNITWTEMIVSQFEQGKIAEEWIVSELAGELLSRTP